MVFCDRCGTEYDEGGFCPDCKADSKPFYRKNEAVGGDERLLLTIRLNAKERALLDEIKGTLDLTSDGGALKIAAFRGWAVLQRTLGADTIRWLSSKERLSRISK